MKEIDGWAAKESKWVDEMERQASWGMEWINLAAVKWSQRARHQGGQLRRGKWMNQLQSIAGPHCAAIDGIDEWVAFVSLFAGL